MMPNNKVSVGWGTIHKILTQPENLIAQCNVCHSYYIDHPRGGDRHGGCNPSDDLKSYCWPRLDNKIYCLICGFFCLTLPDIARHYTTHAYRDCGALGYHKKLLAKYAERVLGG